MKRTWPSVIIACAILLLPVRSVMAQRAEADNLPVIVVTGEADVLVDPDEATVSIGVIRQANTAQAAQDQTNAAANELLEALKKTGIQAKDIQTSRLTLTPVFAPRSGESSQPPRIVAYQASNVVSVHLLDLNKVGPAIDAALKAGSNEIQGVRFGLRNDLSARQQALKQAVTEASQKAETIADAARVQLGPPLEISENGVSLRPQGEGGMMMARPAMAPTPVSAGEITVHASVTIRYRIRQ
jgi:uncharacterized protein YggE